MLKKILIALVAALVLLIVVLYVGGAFMDPHVELSTKRTLKATPEQIFPFVDSAAGVAAWWAQPPDSTMPKLTVKKTGGPDRGAGLVVVFEGDGKIMETWTHKHSALSGTVATVVWDVNFTGAFTVHRTLTFSAQTGGGTEASWQETGEITSPPMRWFKLMGTESVVANFGVALDALDKVALAAPPP